MTFFDSPVWHWFCATCLLLGVATALGIACVLVGEVLGKLTALVRR